MVDFLEKNYEYIASEIPPFDASTVRVRRNGGEWTSQIPGDALEQLRVANNWVEGWNAEADVWYNFPLLVGETVMCEADKICPQTIRLLKSCGLKINVAGFALLQPHTKLMEHTDDETGFLNNSAAFNLMLQGSDSSLYVQGQEIKHVVGKAIVFDSQLEHYADNRGASVRVILYMDISL